MSKYKVMLPFVILSLSVAINGCGNDKATSIDMEKIKQGMTYREVISLLGRPCFKENYGHATNAAWRTRVRDKGIYIEFGGDKVLAIALFDRERIVLRGTGPFSVNIATNVEYQRKIQALLK